MFGLNTLSFLISLGLLVGQSGLASATTLVVVGRAGTGGSTAFVHAACVWDNNHLVLRKSTGYGFAGGWRTLEENGWGVSAWYDSMCDSGKGFPIWLQVKPANSNKWSNDLNLDNCMNNNDHSFYRCQNRYGRYILYDDGGMSGEEIRRHTAECIDWLRTVCVTDDNSSSVCIGTHVENCWKN